MPHVTLPITSNCCNTTVSVGWSQGLLSVAPTLDLTPPAPVSCRALIDTGATLSCIDPGVARRLQLSPKGRISVLGIDGAGRPVPLNLYDVMIHISHHGSNYTLAHEVAVAESPLAEQGIDLLLGMDVLARCLLLVDGPGGTFTLCI